MLQKYKAALLGLGFWCIGVPSAHASLVCGDFTPCFSISNAFSPTVYTVQPGDTFYGIARSHETTPTALAFANQMNLSTALQIGQTLQLPSPGTTCYTIQGGDTLWSIAKQYATTCQELLRLNPTLSAAHLTIGEKIALPSACAAVDVLPRAEVSFSQTSASEFSWPLRGIITSPFGDRSSGTHHGLDIAGNSGDDVRASAGGTVRQSTAHSIYGNYILLDHVNGKQTLYAHLSQSYVAPGQTITPGQIIGAVGSTGNSTGPHLHFEIRQNQLAIDPLPYLPHEDTTF